MILRVLFCSLVMTAAACGGADSAPSLSYALANNSHDAMFRVSFDCEDRQLGAEYYLQRFEIHQGVLGCSLKSMYVEILLGNIWVRWPTVPDVRGSLRVHMIYSPQALGVFAD